MGHKYRFTNSLTKYILYSNCSSFFFDCSWMVSLWTILPITYEPNQTGTGSKMPFLWWLLPVFPLLFPSLSLMFLFSVVEKSSSPYNSFWCSYTFMQVSQVFLSWKRFSLFYMKFYIHFVIYQVLNLWSNSQRIIFYLHFQVLNWLLVTLHRQTTHRGAQPRIQTCQVPAS